MISLFSNFSDYIRCCLILSFFFCCSLYRSHFNSLLIFTSYSLIFALIFFPALYFSFCYYSLSCIYSFSLVLISPFLSLLSCLLPSNSFFSLCIQSLFFPFFHLPLIAFMIISLYFLFLIKLYLSMPVCLSNDLSLYLPYSPLLTSLPSSYFALFSFLLQLIFLLHFLLLHPLLPLHNYPPPLPPFTLFISFSLNLSYSYFTERENDR